MNSAGERRPAPLDIAYIIQHAGLAGAESHDTLGSTNDQAAEHASAQNCQLPYLIHAFHQTRGRGRGTNQWHSSNGSLTFSLMIPGDFAGLQPEHWPRVALVTGLAIAEVIEAQSQSISIQLKWPNDLFIDGKKLAGILVESPPASGTNPRTIIIGVGINVANRLQDAAAEVRNRAISLRDLSVPVPDLNRFLAELCHRILTRVQLSRRNWTELVDLWKTRCALTGLHIVIQQPQASLAGVCLGIDHSGGLRLQKADHSIAVIHSGHVVISECSDA